jgi:hypothetical protein
MRALLVAIVAATGAGGLAPVRFAPRPGWQVGAGTVHACPGVSPARCRQVSSWASTVRWRDCAGCLPHRTLAALPAKGIAIQVSLALERPAVAKQALAWPPRVELADIGGLEGVPDRIGVYQRFARVGRFEAYVFVFFGRSRPTAAQLAASNAELRAAQMP